ncbi:DUF5719 family protein [Nocardioides sp. MAHUQ-72]|uniref:DUF5719 family protein n=1 Tax=unclassified Nocardioides TaxID=2615069 RepID=UPI003608DA22
MSSTTPGRRSSRSRLQLDTPTVLSLLLPLLVVAALLLVHADEQSSDSHPPTRTSLSSASVVCPSAMPGAPATYLSTAVRDGKGEVALRAGDDESTARVAEGEVTTAQAGTGPVVVTGEDALAPGLLGARFGSPTELAATSCPATSPDQWFTGVGAGARHSSVLELVNPDAGPAVADVNMYAGSGLVDVPRLRGVSVPGHSSVSLDLGQVAPRRGELALQVVTARGRLGATVLDSSDELGRGQASADWLPAQPEPTTDNFLLGLGAGEGTRTLAIANPGDSEVRATLRFVSEKSVFAPEGIDEVRVPPQGVARVSLGTALPAAIADGVVGVEVSASGPVTATLRTFVGGDLSHAVAGPPVRTGATAVVPEGGKRVVLAGARAVGAVTVVARSSTGEELARTRADVQPGRGTVVTVPPRATLVSVETERTSVHGAVLVTGRGAAVVPLVEPVVSGLVPDVRPGVP